MRLDRTVLPETTPKNRLIVRPGMFSVVLMNKGRTSAGPREHPPFGASLK